MFERIFAIIMPANLQAGRINSRHLPLLAAAYACLIPKELTFEVFEAALLPYRLALLVVLPFAIANIMRSPIRPSFLDLTVVIGSCWVPIALYLTTSLQAGLVSGGSFALDLGLAYLVGRSAIRTPQDFRTVFLFFTPGLLALLAVFAAESLSHRMILRPVLASLLGLPDPFYYHEVRYGLLRAMASFPHAILGGVFLAGMAPLAWYLSHNNKQRLLSGAVALGAIFTVSSTAIIGLLMGVALIVLDVIQRISRLPVFLIAGFYGLMMAVGIALLSEGGLISFLVRRLTFDSQTGFYRMWIWEYGGAEAVNNPWFGIGQRDWARPSSMVNDSIDSYWLLLAMFYGFPAMAAVLLTMLGAIYSLLKTQKYRHAADRDCARGIVYFLMIAVFAGVTVHLWENVHAWIMLVLGGAVSLATQARIAPAPMTVSEKSGGIIGLLRDGLRKPNIA